MLPVLEKNPTAETLSVAANSRRVQGEFQEPLSSPDLNTRVHVVVDVVVFQHAVSVVIEIDTDLQTRTHKKTNKHTVTAPASQVTAG